MTGSDLGSDLDRIRRALEVAGSMLADFRRDGFDVRQKAGGDPVTEADLAVDEALRRILPRDDDGWLSEETADDPVRLDRRRVWVVDPLDGTREFVKGIPEWCCSIGLVEDGIAVAGGIVNPLTDQTIVGGRGLGVTLNGTSVTPVDRTSLDGARVLASRSELRRGEWARFEAGPIQVVATGSVAYKLGLVAAGLAEATWTLVPKSEWDVAAGVALIESGGGIAELPDGTRPRFNRPRPKLPGLIGAPAPLMPEIRALLRR